MLLLASAQVLSQTVSVLVVTASGVVGLQLAPDPARDIAYLCGNPDMVDQAFALLKDAGLAVKDIRREKYVSSR